MDSNHNYQSHNLACYPYTTVPIWLRHGSTPKQLFLVTRSSGIRGRTRTHGGLASSDLESDVIATIRPVYI